MAKPHDMPPKPLTEFERIVTGEWGENALNDDVLITEIGRTPEEELQDIAIKNWAEKSLVNSQLRRRQRVVKNSGGMVSKIHLFISQLNSRAIEFDESVWGDEAWNKTPSQPPNLQSDPTRK
jgi:hypothetical protein